MALRAVLKASRFQTIGILEAIMPTDLELLRYVEQQWSIRHYAPAPQVDRGITVWRLYCRRWRLFAYCLSEDEARAIARCVPGSVVSLTGPPKELARKAVGREV